MNGNKNLLSEKYSIFLKIIPLQSNVVIEKIISVFILKSLNLRNVSVRYISRIVCSNCVLFCLRRHNRIFSDISKQYMYHLLERNVHSWLVLYIYICIGLKQSNGSKNRRYTFPLIKYFNNKKYLYSICLYLAYRSLLVISSIVLNFLTNKKLFYYICYTFAFLLKSIINFV